MLDKTMAIVLILLLGLTSSACNLAVGQVPTSTPSSASLPPAPTVQTPGTAPVPATYQGLYNFLQQSLNASNALLGPDSGAHQPVVFSADLLPANSNRGTDLLQSSTLDSTRLYLDRLVEMGVRGVKISVQYPMLTAGFPHSAEYVAFYKQVAQMVRDHQLKLMVQTNIVFAGTPFSNVQVNFSNLTFEQFETESLQMTQTVLDAMHPDDLILLSEPDTAARLTGLAELNDPQHVLSYVQYILKGIHAGGTKIGAGTGTWSPITFTKLLAEQTHLDFISLHVYPVGKTFIQNALDMAALAHANGKAVVISEAWLYKTDSAGGGDVAANADVFKRDAFSFWTPLDEQFISLMARLAGRTQADMLDFFWSSYFFGSVDYTPQLGSATYQQVAKAVNQVATPNLLNDRFTPLGEYTKNLMHTW
jgi:hypothetical protein